MSGGTPSATGAPSTAARSTSSSCAPAARPSPWSAAGRPATSSPPRLRSFRGAYPGGASFVVTADTPDGGSFERDYGPLRVTFVSARDLVRMYQGA